jgi:hypothetical protein
MEITPVNVAAVTDALVQLLRARLANTAIGRASELNEDVNNCPWIGVYRDNVRYEVRTLGYGSGMRTQRITLVVAVQESDPDSGDKCEDRLEALLVRVVGALLSDTTLGGTVAVIENLEVRYADYQKVGNSYMQTAAVYLTAQTTVNASQ